MTSLLAKQNGIISSKSTRNLIKKPPADSSHDVLYISTRFCLIKFKIVQTKPLLFIFSSISESAYVRASADSRWEIYWRFLSWNLCLCAIFHNNLQYLSHRVVLYLNSTTMPSPSEFAQLQQNERNIAKYFHWLTASSIYPHRNVRLVTKQNAKWCYFFGINFVNERYWMSVPAEIADVKCEFEFDNQFCRLKLEFLRWILKWIQRKTNCDVLVVRELNKDFLRFYRIACK